MSEKEVVALPPVPLPSPAPIVHNSPRTRRPGLISELKHAWQIFGKAFSLVFGLRLGVAVLLRIIKLVRSNPRRLFSLEELLDEKHVIVRVEAVSYGLAVGGAAGLFELARSLIDRFAPVAKDENAREHITTLVSAAIASSAYYFVPKDSRRNLSLYMLTRLLQCLYNYAKKNGYWHFWGSDWPHGDTLLFVLSSAQIMYAYVMRPETLPDSYYKFIQRTGPIAEPVLQAVRSSNRGKPIDTEAVLNYVKKMNPSTTLTSLDPIPALLGCDILHPHNASCVRNYWSVFFGVMRKILPLYASLTIVPMVALQFGDILKNPLKMTMKATFSTLRSTVFLSCFTSWYQTVGCTYRKIFTKDHRIEYFVAGVVCSLSILIEKKSRRSELALYVLPRALDSAYMQLQDRQWLGELPHGDFLLGALSLAGLLYFYVHEGDTMASMLRYIFRVVLPIKVHSAAKKAPEVAEKEKEKGEKHH